MRLVKPQRLGLIKRSLLWGGRTLLSFGVVTAFPLANPRRLMKEGEMWEAIAPLLGDQVLDSGEPKRRGELVVHGHYFAPGGTPVLQHGVRVTLGPIDKSIRVTGPREWATDANGQVVATPPQPLASLPIDWKYAFGGPAFPENPGGRGHWPEDTRSANARYPLPLLEYPINPMNRPGDIVAPAGLGPRDLMLPSRQRHAGTYDRNWADNHAPGLAADASLDLFQVAAADQQFPAFIAGTERFSVENMHPDLPVQSGQLPGLRVRAFVRYTATPDQIYELTLATDTCVMFPGIGLGLLIHRGNQWVSAFDHPGVSAFLAAFEWQEDAPRPVSHYQNELVRRLERSEEGVRLAMNPLALSPEGWVEPPSDKAAWFKVLQPRPFDVPPALQARIDEAQAQLAKLVPADKMAALAAQPKPDPAESATLTTLRAEMASFDMAAALKNPAAIKPRMDRIKALAQQVADEQLGAAENHLRQGLAKYGLDYDTLKQAAAAAPRPAPMDVLARTDAAIDKAAATAPPEIREKLLAAKLGGDAGLTAQAMKDLATLSAVSKAAIGHAMPAPPPVPPAEAARRTAEAEGLLARNGNVRRGDFAGLNLSGVDFSNRDLSEADFAGCILVGADFSGADLSHVNFAGADLEDARFSGAKLLEANLGKTRLDRADFCKARLIKVSLAEAVGTGTVFAGAELINVTALKPVLVNPSFEDATLREVKFLDAELDGAAFDRAQMEKLVLLNSRADRACFHGATLVRPTFIKSQLREADFSHAALDRLSTVGGVDLGLSRFEHTRMPAASLIGAALARTTWTAANLAGALFNNADLERAVFTSCLLRGALFMRATMTDVWLDGSDCADASFIRADLRRASLMRVSLYGADLTGTLLDDAVIDGGMIDKTILAGRNFPQ